MTYASFPTTIKFQSGLFRIHSVTILLFLPTKTARTLITTKLLMHSYKYLPCYHLDALRTGSEVFENDQLPTLACPHSEQGRETIVAKLTCSGFSLPTPWFTSSGLSRPSATGSDVVNPRLRGHGKKEGNRLIL